MGVEQIENVVPIDLAKPVGLVAPWHARNLNMANHRHMLFKKFTKVSLRPLSVVQIVL